MMGQHIVDHLIRWCSYSAALLDPTVLEQHHTWVPLCNAYQTKTYPNFVIVTGAFFYDQERQYISILYPSLPSFSVYACRDKAEYSAS